MRRKQNVLKRTYDYVCLLCFTAWNSYDDVTRTMRKAVSSGKN